MLKTNTLVLIVNPYVYLENYLGLSPTKPWATLTKFPAKTFVVTDILLLRTSYQINNHYG